MKIRASPTFILVVRMKVVILVTKQKTSLQSMAFLGKISGVQRQIAQCASVHRQIFQCVVRINKFDLGWL